MLDEDPVGVPLDDVPNTLMVPVVALPALALGLEEELGRAAEEEIELGPPVGEDEDAVEDVTADLVGANPVTGLVLA